MLAAHGRGDLCGLASLLPRWSVVLVGRWLVLAFRLHMGLGAFSLRTMVLPRDSRMDLGPRDLLGAFLGKLALRLGLLRMGSVAAGGGMDRGSGVYLARQRGQCGLRLWPGLRRLRLGAGAALL